MFPIAARMSALFLGIVLIGCAGGPPYQAQQPNAETAGASRRISEKEFGVTVEKFYDANPGLRDRRSCVAHTYQRLAPSTWSDLGTAAYAQCFPGPSWIKVVTTDQGRSTFIDSGRIELRQGDQVSFWTMTELFNEQIDFLVVRHLVDCDRRLTVALETAAIVAGRYDASEPAPFKWQSPLPYSQGEGVLDAACRYRAAALRPALAPKSTPRPKASKESEKKKRVGLEI